VAPGGGCLACRGGDASAARSAATPTVVEYVVRAGLAALVVGLLGGVVTTQYVGAKLFSIITPALVGIACGAAATAAARAPSRTRAATLVRVVAMAGAVLGTAYGFRLVVGGSSAFTPAGTVLPPYVAAAAGAWVWTLPPRRRGDEDS
jgi:hypothetical protein